MPYSQRSSLGIPPNGTTDLQLSGCGRGDDRISPPGTVRHQDPTRKRATGERLPVTGNPVWNPNNSLRVRHVNNGPFFGMTIAETYGEMTLSAMLTLLPVE
jgi:hypothetical protein